MCLIDHPNGTDYLFISEDYNGGYTIIDLKNYVEYIFIPNSWYVTSVEPSKDRKKLIVTGCVWGDSYYSKILDFSDPPANKETFVDNFTKGLQTLHKSDPSFTFNRFSEDGENAIFFWQFFPIDKEEEEILRKKFNELKETVPNLEIVIEEYEEKCDGGKQCFINNEKFKLPQDEWDGPAEEWLKVHYYCENIISLEYSVNL